jgi:hypothetical protein
LGGVGGCACDGSGMCIRTLRTLALSSMEAEFTQADDEGGLRRATINRWVSTWCSLDDVHIAPTSTGARVDTWECLLCTMQPKTVAKKKWVGDAFKSHFVCMHDLVGCYNLGKDSPASLCYPFATQTRRRALAEKTAAAKTKAPKAPQQSQPPPQPAPPLQVPMLLPAAAAPQPPPPAAAAPPQNRLALMATSSMSPSTGTDQVAPHGFLEKHQTALDLLVRSGFSASPRSMYWLGAEVQLLRNRRLGPPGGRAVSKANGTVQRTKTNLVARGMAERAGRLE